MESVLESVLEVVIFLCVVCVNNVGLLWMLLWWGVSVEEV